MGFFEEKREGKVCITSTASRYRLYRVLVFLVFICTMVTGSMGASIWSPGCTGACTTSAPDTVSLPDVRTAPVEPQFALYRDDPGLWTRYTAGGHPLGDLPSPVSLRETAGMRVVNGSSFPVKFDLRDTGRVSPVRNQGKCGSCWAFAAMESMESELLPGKTVDFSENNLKNTHGFDPACCAGGGMYMATAYLTRWSGPVYESQDPYDISSCTSRAGIPRAFNVQDLVLVPPKTRGQPVANDDIKAAVQSFGALYCNYYHDDTYYRSQTASYYKPGISGTNHAVNIVGWDDTFSRTNFTITPPGDGAFICRNSWGTDWGDKGFFYVSYYDAQMGYNSIGAFIPPQQTTQYRDIFSHDPLGLVSTLGYGGSRAYAASVFSPGEAGTLGAVGFWTLAPGTSYNVEIYNGAGSSPVSGIKASSASGNLTWPGYHTVPVPGVRLAAGTNFSIVIRLDSPGITLPVGVETREQGYSSNATSSPGECYISPDGVKWTDFSIIKPNGNVCIKGYTLPVTPTPTLTPTPLPTPTPSPTLTPTPLPTPTPSPTLTPTPLPTPTPSPTLTPYPTVPISAMFVSDTTGGPAPLTVRFLDRTTGTPVGWTWSFGDGGISSERNPTHVYQSPGEYTVTLVARGPLGSGSYERPDFIHVQPGQVTPAPTPTPTPLPTTPGKERLYADFTGTPMTGPAPLVVTFRDCSTGNPSGWFWDFGDGSWSQEKSPVHTFPPGGPYSVSLTIRSDMGSSTMAKEGWVAEG